MLYSDIKNEFGGLFPDEIEVLNLIRKGKTVGKAFSIEGHWEIEPQSKSVPVTYRLISAKLISKFKF